jgi:cysteine-rich secretory family protein/hemolysin type calcium-binding protein/FG-GAP repeat protein
MPATALEQMILELVNRARLDPAGEAARYGIDLNEGVPANETISPDSKQPLAMNETLLGVARAHSQDMIDRDYFAHNTPEGVTPFQRMTNAGYGYRTAGENIAYQSTSGAITNQMTIDLHKLLFVDSNIAGRGHRTNLLLGAYQEIGIGQVTGNYQGYNATMLTEDFGTRSSQQFLTGVSYADTDHNNFYSIGEGRASMLVMTTGNQSTSTGPAGGYSLAVGPGVQTVTFSGGGLASPISVAVSITANTNAKVDVIDQGVIQTSASLTDLGGATKIIGLGTFGLTLTGDGGNDTIIGTKGNDTIDGGAGIDTAVFSGNFSAYTLTDLGNGSLRVAGPDGTDTLKNIELLHFADQTVQWPSATTPASLASASDFNGDNFSDVLWRNNASGDTGYTDVHNNGAWHSLGASNTAYSVVGSGDFNGDNFSEVLWRNNTSGDTGYTDVHNNGAWHSLGASNTAYSVVGTGDFNGDNFSDVLWQNNSSGDTGYTDVHNNGAWHGLGASSYSVVGTGDFNGDNFSDVLWRNNATGDTGYSDVHNNGAWHGLGTSSYSVIGTGDFNGDNFSDVLWRNNATGDTGYSDVHNNAWHGLGASSTAYTVVAAGDYNGDGYSDVLWRNDASGDTGYTDVHNNGAWHGLGASSTAYLVVA